MLKKTITYTDYFGQERTEDFYFNLSKSELSEMEASAEGGMIRFIDKIVQTVDRKKLVELFKDLILKSYGEKSADGRRFIKTKELAEGFSQTPAYDILFMELSSDDEAAADFISGVIPSDLAEKVKESRENEVKGDKDVTTPITFAENKE